MLTALLNVSTQAIEGTPRSPQHASTILTPLLPSMDLVMLRHCCVYLDFVGVALHLSFVVSDFGPSRVIALEYILRILAPELSRFQLTI